MAKETLYKVEYLTGRFETIDAQSIASMVLKRYHKNMVMDKDSDSIRNEDIRIEFNKDVQDLAKLFCDTWLKEYPDQPIELCWNSTIKEDPNTAFWAVVHNKGEMTNLHSHETAENYEGGAHVSAAFWVQCQEGSGDFVFQVRPNPYTIDQIIIKPTVGGYALFDSTIPHFVTKNCTTSLRIVISMNFKFIETT